MNCAMKNRTRKRFLCWMVAAVMLLTGVNVSAAEFGAPEGAASEDVFAFGDSVSSYAEPEAVLPEENGQQPETVLPEESGQQPEVFTEQPQEPDTDMEMQIPEIAEEVPEEALSENHGNVASEEEEVSSAGVSAGDLFQIVFADKNGKIYEDLKVSARISEAVEASRGAGV